MKLRIACCTLTFATLLTFSSLANADNPITGTPIPEVTIPSQKTQETIQNKELINNFFKWINSVAQKKLLNFTDIGLYFNPSVTYKVNNKVLANNINSLANRLENRIKNNEEVHILMPLESVIVADSQAAVTYKLHFKNKSNIEHTDHTTALLTFKNGKIASWNAIAALDDGS